jgi:hypothetical protein
MEGPFGIQRTPTPWWKVVLYTTAPALFAALLIAIDRWV